MSNEVEGLTVDEVLTVIESLINQAEFPRVIGMPLSEQVRHCRAPLKRALYWLDKLEKDLGGAEYE